MKIYPTFPTCRAETPTRRAEKLFYEALEASPLDGLALYEVKPLNSAPQLDFCGLVDGYRDLRPVRQGRQVHPHRW